MRLDANDPRWKKIYKGFLSEHLDRPHPQFVHHRSQIEKLLVDKENIRVIKDVGDGRWLGVELADEEDLLMLILKYGAPND